MGKMGWVDSANTIGETQEPWGTASGAVHQQGGLFQDAVEIYHQRCVTRPKDIFHTLYLRFQWFSESLKADRGDSSGLSPSTEVRKTLTFRPHHKRKQRGMVQNRSRQHLRSRSP